MKLSLPFALSCILFFAFAINTQAQSVASETAKEMTSEKTILVKVTGVGCSTDVRTIAANINKLNGVNTCTVIKKAAVTRFEVNFNPAIVSEQKIHATVEDTPGCSNQSSRPYQVKI